MLKRKGGDLLSQLSQQYGSKRTRIDAGPGTGAPRHGDGERRHHDKAAKGHRPQQTGPPHREARAVVSPHGSADADAPLPLRGVGSGELDDAGEAVSSTAAPLQLPSAQAVFDDEDAGAAVTATLTPAAVAAGAAGRMLSEAGHLHGSGQGIAGQSTAATSAGGSARQRPASGGGGGGVFAQMFTGNRFDVVRCCWRERVPAGDGAVLRPLPITLNSRNLPPPLPSGLVPCSCNRD